MPSTSLITAPVERDGAVPRRVQLRLHHGQDVTAGLIDAASSQADACDAYLDLRVCDLAGLQFSDPLPSGKSRWHRLIFGLNDGGSAASIERCNFERCLIEDCFFAAMDLARIDFTEALFNNCDLRFSTLRGVRLGQARFVRCDLYGACLQAATIAGGIRFELCSLPQFGDGITGLDWSSIESSEGRPALIGEQADLYLQFLRRTEHERPIGAGSILDAVDQRLNGAANDYRRMSGYWAAQGRFRDANYAYTQSRRLERKAASPWFAMSRRVQKEGRYALARKERRALRPDRALTQRWSDRDLRPLIWLGLWVADLTSGFGQRLTRVSCCLLAVAVIPGIVYSIVGGVTGAHHLVDCLLFSVARLTAVTPTGMTPATRFVEWIGAIQSLTGIALVGLFGFVLGNVLRQS